jgi:acetyl-CoA carboxylase beta subunit
MKELTMQNRQAFCDSMACVKDVHNYNSTNRVLKNVSVGTVDCPDCRAILFWKPIKRNLTLAEKKKEKKRMKSDMKRDFL